MTAPASCQRRSFATASATGTYAANSRTVGCLARTCATGSARVTPTPPACISTVPCRKTSSLMSPGAQPGQCPGQISLVDDAEPLGGPGDGHVEVIKPGRRVRHDPRGIRDQDRVELQPPYLLDTQYHDG